MPARTARSLGTAALAFALAVIGVSPAAAQPAAAAVDATALIRQAAARIRELQAESERLASQSQTLLIELRQLELERQINAEAVKQAEAALAEVTTALRAAGGRLDTLEAQRMAATPGLHERLVELYKRGRGGYVRLLLQTGDLRALGRMSRGVAAVARLDRARFETHRRRLAAEREAVAELSARQADVRQAQGEATRAREALDVAIATHTRRLGELDRRRDLAARYVGELQSAQAELQQRVGELAAGRPATLPIGPFRGTLEWPVSGRLLSRFGRGTAGRLGTPIVRNGIEIASTPGDGVRAVHAGTVAYAAPFTGFGTLVIVDHGEGAFTLYGHLAEAAVAEGEAVDRGAAVGRAGRNPGGEEATYFELRIDGRPVDPVQWLRSSR